MKSMILSDPESRAIKAGARQIRVPMRAHRVCFGTDGRVLNCEGLTEIKAPYAPGDLVPCKEVFALPHVELIDGCEEEIKRQALCFRADGETSDYPTDRYDPDQRVCYPPKWQPPTRMPLWAVRHFLRITDRRPEKASEIAEADALLCGVSDRDGSGPYLSAFGGRRIINNVAAAWQARYPKHPWADSWCWVIDFKLEGRSV